LELRSFERCRMPSTKAGFDAYATSKQCNLATALALAREHPRLRIDAIDPGFAPATNLGRDAPAVLRVVVVPLLSLLVPFVKGATSPKRAAGVIADAVINAGGDSGVYYDDSGRPMSGSVEVSDPAFQDRAVRETRALLPTMTVTMANTTAVTTSFTKNTSATSPS
jgi:NAD(P)-dependent dehydrogenase (short-subunit alcohol dehydrogenase family)